MLAARHYGVEQEVLRSLADTLPHEDWPGLARYVISRALLHSRRRAEEMREVARTVEEAGVEPLLSCAIAERQDWAYEQGRRLSPEQRPLPTWACSWTSSPGLCAGRSVRRRVHSLVARQQLLARSGIVRSTAFGPPPDVESGFDVERFQAKWTRFAVETGKTRKEPDTVGEIGSLVRGHGVG